MPDTHRFESFSIRAEPGMPPRALLHPAAGAALDFDEGGLKRRIAAIRREGGDAVVAEAALAALQRVSALRDGLARAPLPLVSDAPWRASVLAAAVEASREGLMLATAGAMARIVYANPALGRMVGSAPEALLGRDPAGLLLGAAGNGPGALGLRRADGGVQAVEAVRIVLGPEGATRQARAAEAERCMVPAMLTAGHVAWLLRPCAESAAPLTDPLTGLPTREVVLAALEGALAETRPPCAAWLRVDQLDTVAMRHGAAVRDALLHGLAARLEENLRRIDLLAHLGGGAFLACLPRVSLLEARSIVSRLRVSAAAAPIGTPAGPILLRLRSGLAAAAPGQDAAMLAEAARRAAATRVALADAAD